MMFETWNVNDPDKLKEHDEICREWILEYAHACLGKSAIPHKLYRHPDNPLARAMRVEYETRAEMDQVIKKLFADDKFMEYHEKWNKFVDELPKRVFWDELYSDDMKTNYLKAKQDG